MRTVPLPGALSPWNTSLSLFEKDVALALAPLVRRVHVLIGDSSGDAGETGDPDGYDGLSRRGSLERLLPSEWLLLSEVPDEFLRRTATREQSYLSRSHRPNVAGKSAVLLMDTGPLQLGSPRLVHLAAWVVLSARLFARKGTLAWGALQDTICALRSDVSEASVRALIGARSPEIATRDDIERWLDCPEVRGASEVWICGGEELRSRSEMAAISMLTVTEILDLTEPKLLVRAASKGPSAPREAVLVLPDPRACIRIFRDPFSRAVAPRDETRIEPDPRGGIELSKKGRRLYFRGKKGELCVCVLPNSPRSPVPPPTTWSPPEDQRIVGVGEEHGKLRTLIVCAHEKGYVLHRMSMSRKSVIESTDYPLEEPELSWPPEMRPLVSIDVEQSGKILIVHPNGSQIVLRDGTATSEQREPSKGELAKAMEAQRLESITLPPGFRAVASIASGRAVEGRATLIVTPDQKRLELVVDGEWTTLVSTETPIALVETVDFHRLVGVMTEHGEVLVYSIYHRAVLRRIAPGGLLE